MCTLNLMTSLRILSISVCSSSRRALARRVSCSNLGKGPGQHVEIAHCVSDFFGGGVGERLGWAIW